MHVPALLTYGAAYVTVTRGPGGRVRFASARGPKDIPGPPTSTRSLMSGPQFVGDLAHPGWGEAAA